MTQSRRIHRPVLCLIAIALLAGVRPGDTPWVSDEPIMMELALRYNHTASDIYGFNLPFTPCPFGGLGTRGARYGPLPIWLDQIALIFTHNPITMVAVRAVLFCALTAIGFLWLARELRLSPWYAVVTLLSPWLLFYARNLWDITWSIPVSAFLLAAYLSFQQRPTGRALRIALLCTILLPLFHPMGLALVVPIALHFLYFHSRTVWKWKWSLAAIVVLCSYLFWPYLAFFITHTKPSLPSNASPFLGWLFPLLGGNYLTLGVAGMMPADGWQEFAPPGPTITFFIAQWIARLAIPAVWIGMLLAIPRARRALRSPTAAPIDHLCLIALATWFCQTLLDGLERVYQGPQYYVGTWIVYVFFGWIAVDTMMHAGAGIRPIARAGLAAYLLAILLGTTIIAHTVARNGGTHTIYYGTGIASQVQAIERIRQYSDRSIETMDIEVPNWKLFPVAPQALLEMNPPPPGPRPDAHLVVKFLDAWPGDSRIEVHEISSGGK